MRLFRTRARSSFDNVLTSRSSSKYRPALGVSKQPSRCIIVDLPLPDGPINATNSPASTSMLTPRSAFTVLFPTM
jgi:hypothetical protein